MSSIKVSFGKVLETVNSASNAVVTTFDSVSSGVGMLNNRIQTEAIKQRKDIAIELKVYDTELVENTSRMLVERSIEVEKFKSQSSNHRTLFDEYSTKLEEVLKEA